MQHMQAGSMHVGSAITHLLAAWHWAAARDPPHAESSSLMQASCPPMHPRMRAFRPAASTARTCASAWPSLRSSSMQRVEPLPIAIMRAVMPPGPRSQASASGSAARCSSAASRRSSPAWAARTTGATAGILNAGWLVPSAKLRMRLYVRQGPHARCAIRDPRGCCC